MALHNPIAAQVFARKPEGWTEPSIPTITNPQVLAALKDLPTFPAGGFPGDDLPPERPQYFIAERFNGERFLVDTQGYDYCRYVARIPKDLPKTGAELADACKGEQVADLIDVVREVGANGGSAALRDRANALIAEIEGKA